MSLKITSAKMAAKLIIRVSRHLLAEVKPCLYAYSVGRGGAKTFTMSFQKLFIYLLSCVLLRTKLSYIHRNPSIHVLHANICGQSDAGLLL